MSLLVWQRSFESFYRISSLHANNKTINVVSACIIEIIAFTYLSSHIWTWSQFQQAASEGSSCLEVLKLQNYMKVKLNHQYINKVITREISTNGIKTVITKGLNSFKTFGQFCADHLANFA